MARTMVWAICWLVVTASGNLAAQRLHTVPDMLMILDSSRVSYELFVRDKPEPDDDFSDHLLFHDMYRVKNGDQYGASAYAPTEEAEQLMARAEDYYGKRDWSEARRYYLKTLQANSTYYKALTYVGQTYEAEGDIDEAMIWYEKAVRANYIDYMAHWFLADAWRAIGDPARALDEIVIAKILNRNNPRIDISLQAILKLNKRPAPLWGFYPQFKADSLGPDRIKIDFHVDWMPYAFSKTLWYYEPGYAESLNNNLVLSEREALIGMFASADKKFLKKHPEIQAFGKAVSLGLQDGYILYEVLLPRFPQLVYQLNDEDIKHIQSYALQVRYQK